LGIGLYFLANNQLEYGVEAAARKVRTGEAQKTSLTVDDFKKSVCTAAGSYIDCSKLSVIVQHAPTWSGISPQACVDSKGNMTASTGTTGEFMSKYTGAQSEVVLVTLCYQWDLATSFAFIKLGKNSDGSGPAIIQAATAFRTEPYL
jgi:Flp pilus assembly protein TadG